MASPGMSIHDQAKEGTLTRSWLQDHLSKEPDDLDEYNFDGYTPLSLAVREGQVGAVKLLLLKKADANKTVRDGRTPLYIAMSAKQSTERIAQLLLAHGANVNFPIEEWGNETAIMAAITQSRDPEVVRLLVENGASLTRANDRGDTARSLADQSANPAIHKALLPKDKQEGWQTELESLLVSTGLFARAYFTNSKDAIENAARRISSLINSEKPAKASAPLQLLCIILLTATRLAVSMTRKQRKNSRKTFSDSLSSRGWRTFSRRIASM